MMKCTYCGAKIDSVPMITSQEVKHMHGKEHVSIDEILNSYLRRFGQPKETQLYQLVFENESEIPEELRSSIRKINGEYYYTSEESTIPNVRVTHMACRHCHSDISNVLAARRTRTAVLVAPAEGGKTASLAALSACVSSDSVMPGFSAGSFEHTYYSMLAADLLNGRVPDPTPCFEGMCERQPLYFLKTYDGTLVSLIDQPGENIKQNQYHIPANAIVVFMIDGSDMEHCPITDYIRIATEYSHIKSFIITVTKSDLLDQEAVKKAMLTEYIQSTKFPFTYRELQMMRRASMPRVLKRHFPVVAQLENQLRMLDGRFVDVVFTAAIGTSAEDGVLLGKFNPMYMTDFALALAQ